MTQTSTATQTPTTHLPYGTTGTCGNTIGRASSTDMNVVTCPICRDEYDRLVGPVPPMPINWLVVGAN